MKKKPAFNKRIYSRPGVHTVEMFHLVRRLSVSMLNLQIELEKKGWNKEEIEFVFQNAIRHADVMSGVFGSKEALVLVRKEKHGDEMR